jgi:hypothetical protein
MIDSKNGGHGAKSAFAHPTDWLRRLLPVYHRKQTCGRSVSVSQSCQYADIAFYFVVTVRLPL